MRPVLFLVMILEFLCLTAQVQGALMDRRVNRTSFVITFTIFVATFETKDGKIVLGVFFF